MTELSGRRESLQMVITVALGSWMAYFFGDIAIRLVTEAECRVIHNVGIHVRELRCQN